MAPSRKPPLELDVEVETAEGAVFRLASNDPKAANRPSGINFSTQRGDGFATGTFTLNREIFKDYPDLNLLDSARFTGRQGDIAYEGRQQSFPRQNDPQQQISQNLVGWMTYLKGRPMAALIIDRRLSGWTGPSNQRRANLLTSGYRFEAEPETGWQAAGATGPGVTLSFARFDGVYSELGEIWFYADGQDIGQLIVDELVLAGSADGNFVQALFLCTDDVASVFDSGSISGNVSAANMVVTAGAAGRKYALINSQYLGAFAGDSNIVQAFVNPRVIGTHGLTKRGTAPREGYYISDIVEYLLGAYRPKIQWAGEINTFPVEQATWHDSASNPYDAIQQLNNLVLWETNVWEERKFYFEPADLTKTDWQIKTTDPGVSVNFQGDSIENFANGVVITYSDFFGHTYRLEPSDHPELRDESDNNPANRHGEELWTEKAVRGSALKPKRCSSGAPT